MTGSEIDICFGALTKVFLCDVYMNSLLARCVSEHVLYMNDALPESKLKSLNVRKYWESERERKRDEKVEQKCRTGPSPGCTAILASGISVQVFL